MPGQRAETDSQVRDFISKYTDDYTVFNRRYLAYSSSQNSKESVQRVVDIQKGLKKHDYEIDVLEDPPLIQRAESNRNSIRLKASNAVDLKSSKPDALLAHLLDDTLITEVDQENKDRRRVGRHQQLFSVYPPPDESEEVIERREIPALPAEHFGQRILIKCLELRLEFEMEPLFATMALYDLREKKKISENFYFDLASEPIKKLLIDHVPRQDISSLSRSCIFNITYPSPDIFIVVRLEKVLQPGDVSETYTKDLKSINRDKVAGAAKQYCEKLGAYRMPFAITAMQLMNVVTGANSLEKDATLGSDNSSTGSSGSLDRRMSALSENFVKRSGRDDSLTRSVSGVTEMRSFKSQSLVSDKRSSWYEREETIPNLDSFRPVTITVSSFFKQEVDKLNEEDLYKFLGEVKRSSSALKKLKTIPGMLRLDVSPCPEEPKYCLSPELYKIQPYPDDKGRPTKEVAEFPPRELFVPYTSYRNLLYIYPQNVNFTNRPGSARNIAIKIQFVAADDEKRALPVIFGKSSCPELTTQAYTAVAYHNRNPDFYDEVKVKLPAKIQPGQHILFTFYHISCQLQKKEASQPTESLLGYSWLPMMRDGRLHVGEFCLPICADKPPPHYTIMVPDISLPGVKWLDNHKGLFSVGVKALSSIHTQDEKLDDFLQHCASLDDHKRMSHANEAKMEKELKDCITNVSNASLEPLVRFLPLILDEMVKLITRPPLLVSQTANIAPTAFEAMATIVCAVTQQLLEGNDMHGRNNLLTSYIHYCASLSPSNDLMGSYRTPRPQSVPDFGNVNSPVSAGRPVSMRPDEPNRMFSISSPGSDVSRQQPRQQFKLVHEELALQWVVSNATTREKAMCQASFFFELMVKSMAEHLSAAELMNSSRKPRFPTQFTDDCTALVVMITKEVVDKYVKEPTYVRQLNSSLGFFLFDILSLMDRGYVFNLCKYYCKALTARITSTSADTTPLILLKLNLMRIVCSHEHYLTLNLPFTNLVATPMSSMSLSSLTSSLLQQPYTLTTELSDDFRQQHFLVGIILCDLVTSLQTNNPVVHQKAIRVVSNLLYCHDLDPRFNDPLMRSKIAQLYLPLLNIACDVLDKLWNPTVAPRANTGSGDFIDMSVARMISTSNVAGTRPSVIDKQSKASLNYECTRSLLISCLWILKNIDQQSLLHLWKGVPPPRLSQILEMLHLCLINFEYKAQWIPKVTVRETNTTKRSWTAIGRKYSFNEDLFKAPVVDDSSLPTHKSSKSATLGAASGSKLLRSSSFSNMLQSKDDSSGSMGTLGKTIKYVSQQTIKKSSDMKSKLEDVILGGGSARNEFLSRRKQGSTSNTSVPPSPQTDTRLRWRKDQTQWRQERDNPGEKMKGYSEPDFVVLGHLASEVSMTALDTLELIIQIIQSQDSLQNLLTGVLRVLLQCLAVNQSSYVLQHVFATQRALVTKYRELLFEDNTEACADLCLHLLRHCSSSLCSTRSHAAASLYMLMRQNFEIGNNFARVKMQVTMSLSHLVGQTQFFNEEFLRSSLKTILIYAEKDLDLQDTTFPDQVKELVFNLHMILSDTVKMKEFQEDPEMLVDLMYRIAKGYQNSPDLRLTWLQNMASKHTANKNHAEAAECYVHCAGLVVEYMNMIEEKRYLPVGCVGLQKVSKNVLEESAVSDDVVSPDEEGICTGTAFTDPGLINLLDLAADSFSKAGMYEMVNEVYKVLTPIHEAYRQYDRLSVVHGTLQHCFENIISNEGKRMFGTYFRVGFYGAKFGDLNGQEFVYKEPSITKLSEIAHRLENFYGDRFGRENVHMIKDSNQVETEKLEPGKAFIQLTYVEPYFDAYELKDRHTYFERNYDLRRFVYSTPFTLEGKAHGELAEQHKRKTILTTSQAFPYIKTRIAVIEKEQKILQPIEVAIEDVQKKLKELTAALVMDPLDPKILQMVLQGCIGTTVNQGPVEVATVFLADVASGIITPSRHHNKLRLCLKDFIKKCETALERNRSLIGDDQKAYQKELERNYRNVKEQLYPMTVSANSRLATQASSPVRAARGRSRENRKSGTSMRSFRS
ncbi:dedicator of cytokinesis protein 7-like [Watersipora subatra]|uniref:dedicator of cytokinesis protein 7-like n=1 Tax=Watersipora subatra TaxID=2589382 RepID=UPI00355BCA08